MMSLDDGLLLRAKVDEFDEYPNVWCLFVYSQGSNQVKLAGLLSSLKRDVKEGRRWMYSGFVSG